MDQRIISVATNHGENFLKAQDDVIYKNFLVRKNLKAFHHLIEYYGVFLIIPESIVDTVDDFDPYQTMESYSDISYEHIDALAKDIDPLDHWAEIRGAFSTMDGEVLRFILAMKIPLEKFIRHELAARGYDENHDWIGFEKARAIWLKEE